MVLRTSIRIPSEIHSVDHLRCHFMHQLLSAWPAVAAHPAAAASSPRLSGSPRGAGTEKETEVYAALTLFIAKRRVHARMPMLCVTWTKEVVRSAPRNCSQRYPGCG